VNAKVEGPHHVDANVADKHDGSYEVSYTPTKIGKYTLGVDVNGTPIGGGKNPFPVLVIAAPPSGANSIATGPGLSNAQVGGSDNKFRVETRDAFDNPVTMGGADVGGFLEKEGEVPIPIRIVDNEDGSYDCSYSGVKKAGTYTLTPTVSGERVRGAPFTVTVAPGGFSVDNTRVDFPDEWVATLPGPIISVCDAEGKLRTNTSDKVEARLTPLDDLDIKAKAKEDGSFTLAFPPNARGEWNVKVRVNNQEAPGGPWKVSVAEHPLSDAHEQAISSLMPHSREVFRRLLLDCSPDERDKVLKELAKMAGNQYSSSSSTD